MVDIGHCCVTISQTFLKDSGPVLYPVGFATTNLGWAGNDPSRKIPTPCPHYQLSAHPTRLTAVLMLGKLKLVPRTTASIKSHKLFLTINKRSSSLFQHLSSYTVLKPLF